MPDNINRQTERDVETVLAEVLAAHEDFGLYAEHGGDTNYVCSCDRVKRPGAHRAHVAAEQAAALRALPTGDEAECRYPCGCEQFPEEHCSCMDGHTTTPPAQTPNEETDQ